MTETTPGQRVFEAMVRYLMKQAGQAGAAMEAIG